MLILKLIVYERRPCVKRARAMRGRARLHAMARPWRGCIAAMARQHRARIFAAKWPHTAGPSVPRIFEGAFFFKKLIVCERHPCVKRARAMRGRARLHAMARPWRGCIAAMARQHRARIFAAKWPHTAGPSAPGIFEGASFLQN